MKTQITELLKIKHPIIQGGMMWVAKKELASAVSNAGGLGVMTALSFESPERLAREIYDIKQLTDNPFGINFTFLPTLKPVPYQEYIQAAIDAGVKIVETSGRSPEPYMPLFKKHGVKVIHKCITRKHAMKAQKVGVDVVAIDGFECAGHPGEEGVTSLVLVPTVAESLTIPVLASGGFGDGRGLAAALSLGAEGIVMGTRFLATRDAGIHQNISSALVNSTENQTSLVARTLKNTSRVLSNEQAERVIELESAGAGLDKLAPLMSGLLGKKALETGEVDSGLIACGQVVGLVHDIPSIEELINRIMEQADQVIKKLSGLSY